MDDNATVTAEILAYYDDTAWMDDAGPDGDREHRDILIETLCREAIVRDRDLLEQVIRGGVERGRSAALREVVEHHRERAETAELGRAVCEGEIIPLRGPRPARPRVEE